MPRDKDGPEVSVCRSFEALYSELSLQGIADNVKLVVVVKTATDSGVADSDSFFSKLSVECLAIPFFDFESHDNVCESLNLFTLEFMRTVACLAVHPDGKVLQVVPSFLPSFLDNYGARSFPFTQEHFESINLEDEIIKLRLISIDSPISLGELLQCDSLSEIGDENKSIPTSDLEGYLSEGYDYYYLHNCVKRVTVYCKQRCDCVWNKKKARFGKCICGSKNKCGFKVHGRLLERQNTFQVKSLQLKHKDNCLLADKNTKMTAEYLAEKYIDEFRLDPDYKVNTLIGKVMKDSGVEVGYHKAYLAKKKAYEMIYGMDAEQYKRVWDFANTVKKHNPGSSMFVSLGGIDRPPPFFQRMYMCLHACKVGFVSGCRPILGLDGCHLNGLYLGILLVAVGKDSNCNIFPLAWAVVEVENKETWTWFLQLLVQDIESVAHEDSYIKSKDELAFIFDRQKGLMEAFNIVTPNAELRFCARHIWANFSKTYNGIEYKQMFWKAARAYTKHEFDMSMESIRGMSTGAFAYLNAIPPKHWSRHAFSTQTKSEILLNNCCESFNNVLKQCRDKPILTLMEWIRRYVMNRMFTRFQILEKYKGNIMNTATKSLSKAAKESRNYEILQPALMEFEVISKGDVNERWVVDLNKRTCECFKWELTGIPCAHAYGCLLVKKRIDPATWVHKAYSRELYGLAYSTHVHPIPGPINWEKTTHVQPTPPPFRKMPGRPSSKKRKRDPNEKVNARATKKNPAKCNNCGIEGHYMKSCKNPGVAKRPKKTTLGKGSKTNQVEVAF